MANDFVFKPGLRERVSREKLSRTSRRLSIAATSTRCSSRSLLRGSSERRLRRRRAVWFVWWKSPLSTSVAGDAWNDDRNGIRSSASWSSPSDAIALLVLPTVVLATSTSSRAQDAGPAGAARRPVSCVSTVNCSAFAATSQGLRSGGAIDTIGPTRLESTTEELLDALVRLEISPMVSYDLRRDELPERGARATIECGAGIFAEVRLVPRERWDGAHRSARSSTIATTRTASYTARTYCVEFDAFQANRARHEDRGTRYSIHYPRRRRE